MGAVETFEENIKWVAAIEHDEVQSPINEKESNIQLYKQACDLVWLVIVQDIFQMGAPSEANEHILEKSYLSNFDKVIWLEINPLKAAVLNVRKF